MASSAYDNDRLKQTQQQVNEIVDIMRDNVTAVMEREEKLTELDDRADKLQIGAMIFEKQATTLKRKKWWANMKMMIIIGIVVLVLIVIIILSLMGN